MVDVAQDARPTVVGANVAMVVVAQDARRTVVGCSMSRWLMSRRMRDVRWVGCPMSDVAQDARRTRGIEFLFRNSKETV
ncbi:MAG: hypothetical protein CMF17_01190 [Idiomarinaceae bacterium]|nr:hypothetical protein [Idiomarinaceae bacterium]